MPTYKRRISKCIQFYSLSRPLLYHGNPPPRLNAYRVSSALEPGGYLELQDLHTPFGCDDGTLTEDTPTYRFGSVAIETIQALGRPLDVPPMHKDRMRKAGFVDVVERQFKWPIGTWPKDRHYKEIGYWSHANLNFGLEGLMMALLTRGLGWTKEEVMVFCTDVRRGLKDPQVHAYIPM